MHLYVITGAANEQRHFLKDDPNFAPQKYVVLRSSLEVFCEVRNPHLLSTQMVVRPYSVTGVIL